MWPRTAARSSEPLHSARRMPADQAAARSRARAHSHRARRSHCSDVFAAQMAFFNFPNQYATAPAQSVLPGPLRRLMQACCGEGDLEDVIPAKTTFGADRATGFN